MIGWPRGSIAFALLMVAACAAPAPQARPTVASSSPVARATTAVTPTPVPAALRIVPLRLIESPLPPAAPTPDGLPASRGTPTPATTAEPAWKYVTIVFGIENLSETARLVGIGGGGDPSASNLAAATLGTRDGKRYKAVSSYSSFGWRTAVARSLAGYPVLLRLPPGFRAAAESFAGFGTSTIPPNSITFKIPAALTDYGTLTIPSPMLGGKGTADEVVPKLRPLIGPLEPLDLSGVRAGDQQVTFPTASPPTQLLAIGTPVTGASRVVVTLSGVEVSDPADYQVRAKGWKEVAFTLRYRNADPDQPHTFTASAWFFGQDGVVYSGDVPAVGDFGRALTVPDPAVMMTWDGRAAGSDQIGAGQERDRPPLRFLVPHDLKDGILVLGGDVEAQYTIAGLTTPPQP